MDALVETSYGAVQGTSGDGVEVYRGIPFARPPVGELRFRPPERLEPWDGVLDASGFRAAPLQADSTGSPLDGIVTFAYPEQDEDCLTLNIWTPAADGRRRPVMVWIHGGGFVNGAGSLPMYDGSQLARNGDVVVVTLNYRLGVFGFLHLDSLCGEEFGASGNQGLFDQVAALEWVRGEIGAFGGDPTNVTLFGQSAGALSIATMMSMPETTGLFEKAILQSSRFDYLQTPEPASEVAERVLRELGLTPEDAGRLREIPAQQLIEAQDRVAPRNSGAVFGPVADGERVPADLFSAFADGDAASVSVLIGTNEDEMKLSITRDPATENMSEAQLLSAVTRLLGGSDHEERAAAAIETYRSARLEREEDVAPRELLSAIATDVTYRAPALRLAEMQAKHTPGYTYIFDWPSPAQGGAPGATHLLEVPFVFGTYAHPHLRDFCGSDAAAEELSNTMQEAWVRFARFGSPSTPTLPEWPAYEPGQRWTMRLGAASSTEEHPREDERAFWDHPVNV